MGLGSRGLAAIGVAWCCVACGGQQSKRYSSDGSAIAGSAGTSCEAVAGSGNDDGAPASGGTSGTPTESARPSCEPGGPGLNDCGPDKENCCASTLVPGGSFFRSSSPSGLAAPATVSDFRLDKYAVTVGRFRRFVAAWNDGYRPPAGSGKHTHLNEGRGLARLDRWTDPCDAFESGWLPADNERVAPTDDQLVAEQCRLGSWTPSPDGPENRPVSCVNWYEAYAFCIWDGGFLPSDAEGKYAAAGGSEQRLYPWGDSDPGTANEYAIYHYVVPEDGFPGCYYPRADRCSGPENFAPVGSALLGAGRWGHLDLVGNVSVWQLDTGGPTELYPLDCANCATLRARLGSILTGGWGMTLEEITTLLNHYAPEDARYYLNGIRCARAP